MLFRSEATINWNQHESPVGITPYTFSGNSGSGAQTCYSIISDGRSDLLANPVQKNFLPGEARNTVATTGGSIATWLQTTLPVWRWYYEVGGQTVAQSEFTVAETISGKAFMCGCLMNGSMLPKTEWIEFEPATSRWQRDGMMWLP